MGVTGGSCCSDTVGMARKPALPPLTARMRSHKSSQAVVNARFYTLLGTILLAAAAGVFATFAWLGNTPPQPDLLKAQPQGKAVAELTAAAVLAGRPLPVPLASSVSNSDEGITVGNGTPLQVVDLVWSGFTPSVTAGIAHERHVFEFTTLSDPKNPRSALLAYQMVIIVLVSDNDVPMLGAMPYLLPAAVPSQRLSFDYGAAKNLSKVPESVRSRLTDWATYWASDDRERLQTMTGDGRTTVEYAGLGGFVSEGINVLAAVPQPEGPWVLRVRVSLIGPNGFSTEVDMDVTVGEVSNATPQIVAWGPAGSGVLAVGHNSKNKI